MGRRLLMTAALTIAVEDVRHTFPKSGFTLDVSRLEVTAGRTRAILGPSGSGKTTLLHILGLLEKPDNGRVLLDGRPVTGRDREARLMMAAVMQRPYLFRSSVEANVEYGLIARGVPAGERARRVRAALERVGLAGFERRSAAALSGGEAQRVSLARALVVDPRVLLLDEPFANLDPMLKQQLTREFAGIVSESDMTVVWVTHDQDEALTVAEEIAVMNSGRIVADGPAEQVTGLPGDGWTAAFLGVEEPQTGTVARSEAGIVGVAAGGVVVDVTGAAPVGAAVHFAVRPEDVLLFQDGAELPHTSARNRLPAQVVSVQRRGATDHVVLDAGGLRLAARVSRASAADLGLVPGVPVLAVFKASAVRWRVVE